MVRKPKILYVAHGRAGLEVFDLLTGKLGLAGGQILLFTYGTPANEELLRRARNLGVGIALEKIGSESAFQKVREFGPDFVVSMHARELIPGRILALAPLGGMNLHPSLLPKYRGCFSGPWAIINQEPHTGISYHFMNEKFDDGSLILQEVVPLSPGETGYSLFEKLVDAGVLHFERAFRLVIEEGTKGYSQLGSATYYSRKLPFDGVIDPAWDEPKVDAFIRAMTFPGFPGARLATATGYVEIHNLDQFLHLIREKALS